jgi:hypothetical protein
MMPIARFLNLPTGFSSLWSPLISTLTRNLTQLFATADCDHKSRGHLFHGGGSPKSVKVGLKWQNP